MLVGTKQVETHNKFLSFAHVVLFFCRLLLFSPSLSLSLSLLQPTALLSTHSLQVFCCIALVAIAILYFCGLWLRQLFSWPKRDVSVSELPGPPRALTGHGALPVYGHTRLFQDLGGEMAQRFDPTQKEIQWLASSSLWNRPLGTCFASFVWGQWRVVVQGTRHAHDLLSSQPLEESWPWTPPRTLLGQSCFAFLTSDEKRDLTRLLGRCLGSSSSNNHHSHSNTIAYPLLVQLYAKSFAAMAEKCLHELTQGVFQKATTAQNNHKNKNQNDTPSPLRRRRRRRRQHSRRHSNPEQQERRQTRRRRRASASGVSDDDDDDFMDDDPQTSDEQWDRFSLDGLERQESRRSRPTAQTLTSHAPSLGSAVTPQTLPPYYATTTTSSPTNPDASSTVHPSWSADTADPLLQNNDKTNPNAVSSSSSSPPVHANPHSQQQPLPPHPNHGPTMYKLKWIALRSYTLDLMDGPILNFNQWLPPHLQDPVAAQRKQQQQQAQEQTQEQAQTSKGEEVKQAEEDDEELGTRPRKSKTTLKPDEAVEQALTTTTTTNGTPTKQTPPNKTMTKPPRRRRRQKGEMPVDRDLMLLWMERMKNGIDVIKTTFGPEWMYIWMLNEYGRALNARMHLEAILQRHVAHLATLDPTIRHLEGHVQHDVTTQPIPIWAMHANRLRQTEGIWGDAHIQPQFASSIKQKTQHLNRQRSQSAPHVNYSSEDEDYYPEEEDDDEEEENDIGTQDNGTNGHISPRTASRAAALQELDMVVSSCQVTEPRSSLTASRTPSHATGGEDEPALAETARAVGWRTVVRKKMAQVEKEMAPYHQEDPTASPNPKNHSNNNNSTDIEQSPQSLGRSPAVGIGSPPNSATRPSILSQAADALSSCSPSSLMSPSNRTEGVRRTTPTPTPPLATSLRRLEPPHPPPVPMQYPVWSKSTSSDEEEEEEEKANGDTSGQGAESTNTGNDDEERQRQLSDVQDMLSIASAPQPVTRTTMSLLEQGASARSTTSSVTSHTQQPQQTLQQLHPQSSQDSWQYNAESPDFDMLSTTSTVQMLEEMEQSVSAYQQQKDNNNKQQQQASNNAVRNPHVSSPNQPTPAQDFDPQSLSPVSSAKYMLQQNKNQQLPAVPDYEVNGADGAQTVASEPVTRARANTTMEGTATATMTNKIAAATTAATPSPPNATGAGTDQFDQRRQTQRVIPLLERIMRQHDLAGNGISQVVAMELSLLIWMMMDAGNAYTAMALSLLSTDREACLLVQQELDDLQHEFGGGVGGTSPLYTPAALSRMKYLDALLYEAIRLCPANLGGMKKTTETVEMVAEGVQIPKGTNIFFCQATELKFDIRGAVGKKPELLGRRYPCVEL